MKTIDVIIETPKGSRNKYNYDKETKMFRLKKTLPAGFAFPYDFGFVPDTLAEDGDPIDVLVLLDESTFPGCIVPCRIIGAIKANQTQKSGKVVRNDRLIAVADSSSIYSHIGELEQLDKKLMSDLESFFIAYNQQEGKKFEPLERVGSTAALRLLEETKNK
jgi:inorganic pyrophosphatase